MLPLSVLDLSFTTTATGGAAALRHTVELARLVDRLGYRRFWVAEHHNLPSVASGAPEIMIGAIAAATRRMRVGSGGVMLPNHAPLMVAERFKVLEALYPGRIDLGIGRAPGTDQLTSMALRRRQEIRADDDFLERFQRADGVEERGFPRGASVPQDPGRCRRTCRCRRSGCSARASTARSWPAGSASALPSRTISPASTRPRPCGCTAILPPSAWLDGPTPSWPRPRSAPRPTPRPSGWPDRRLQLCAAHAAATTARW